MLLRQIMPTDLPVDERLRLMELAGDESNDRADVLEKLRAALDQIDDPEG